MLVETVSVVMQSDKQSTTMPVQIAVQANMVKQLAKLVKVRYVEDVTFQRRIGVPQLCLAPSITNIGVYADGSPKSRAALCLLLCNMHMLLQLRVLFALSGSQSKCADRELALFKVSAPHGAARSTVLELTSIFRGKVVDVGPLGLVIALSGDVGKVFAFEQSLRAFGLMQLARTGRITLQTSDVNLDMPGNLSYSPSRRATAPAESTDRSGACSCSHVRAYKRPVCTLQHVAAHASAICSGRLELFCDGPLLFAMGHCTGLTCM